MARTMILRFIPTNPLVIRAPLPGAARCACQPFALAGQPLVLSLVSGERLLHFT
jgi:hypothetical protein